MALICAMLGRGIISTAAEGPTVVIINNSVDTDRPKVIRRHILNFVDPRADTKSNDHRYESWEACAASERAPKGM